MRAAGLCFRWTTQGVVRIPRHATHYAHEHRHGHTAFPGRLPGPRQPPVHARHYSDDLQSRDQIQPLQSEADSNRARAVRPKTTEGLPAFFTSAQRANLPDPFPDDPFIAHVPESAARLPRLGRRPSRVRQFLETLPIRNLLYDFGLWDLSLDERLRRFALLPEPRCRQVSAEALRLLIQALAQARPRTQRNQTRLLALLNEMRSEGLPLSLENWSVALSYVGRARRRPDERALQHCIALWREMESTTSLRADLGIFNTLLDVAVRARRPQAVTVLLNEMQVRDITPDRYTYCIQIALAGLQREGDVVRRLYRDLVASGEIVDIVVVNSVLQGLLRAGESEAAELIYARLRRRTLDAFAQGEQTPLPPVRGAEARRLTRQFQARAQENRHKLAEGQVLDEGDISPAFAVEEPYGIAPNHVTLGLLLRHHCTITGDFERVLALLEDRQQLCIPEDQALYQALFQGFARFGSTASSAASSSAGTSSAAEHDETGRWTAARLAHIFNSLIDTLERQDRDRLLETLPPYAHIRLTQDLTIAILRAYGRLFRPYKVRGCYRTLEKVWLVQGGRPDRLSNNIKACFEEIMAGKLARKLAASQGRSSVTANMEATGTEEQDEMDDSEESELERSLQQQQEQEREQDERQAGGGGGARTEQLIALLSGGV